MSGLRSMLDVSSFTLTPNGGGKSPSPTRSSSLATRTNGGGPGGGLARSATERIMIEDPRWKWVEESMFPKPREFRSKPRHYRAGRGSSVPLDLSALR